MQTPTARSRRPRELEEDPNRGAVEFTARLQTGTPSAEPSISSLVLPSTETPPPIHPRQIDGTSMTALQGNITSNVITVQENIIGNATSVQADGSLQSQEIERDKALAAWNDIFGHRQACLGHADNVPLCVVRHLGRGGGGSVDETTLGGVAVAWKRISTRARRLTPEETNEVQILGQISKRRHRHIVELIGSYTHRFKGGIELGMLIWPVAHCDLGHFLHDIDYLGDSLREPVNANITSDDLESVMDNLYPLITDVKPTQKHPDDRGYRYELYRRALTYLRSNVGCIGQAVAYLHQSGIRHKDLKPAQVLLSGSGLWLTDFGWSKDISQLTNSVTNGGHEITLKYHAPERTAGRPCGKPEDIFALGCIFLEIGYRLLREDPQKIDVRLPWAAKKSFSASLENTDTWIAPFIDQPQESFQHFGHVIKQMLHIDPKTRPTIVGVIEMLSMPYRNPGSTKISNPFVSSCCRPVRWASFHDMNGVLVPQQLRTIVDPIARKTVGRWVKRSKRLSINVNQEASKTQIEDGSMAGFYYLSEDTDMSDTDSVEENESSESRETEPEKIAHPGQAQSFGDSPRRHPLPQLITSKPDQLPLELSTDFYNDFFPPAPDYVSHNLGLYWTSNSQTTLRPDESQIEVDKSPYQHSLDIENSIYGIPTYDCGMTISRVTQPDGSISVKAYYPPEYPVALRGRRLGTLEKDKALELLAKANMESMKLVPVTRDDGRRSVTPAPPSPNPGRTASLQSPEENPGRLWKPRTGNELPKSTLPSLVSTSLQRLAPIPSGQPELTYPFPFKCNICGFDSFFEETVKDHYERLHGRFPLSYLSQNDSSISLSRPDPWCSFCGVLFSDDESFQAHNEVMHGVLPRSAPRPDDTSAILSNSELGEDLLPFGDFLNPPVNDLFLAEPSIPPYSSRVSSSPLAEDLDTLRCNICGVEFTGTYRKANLLWHEAHNHQTSSTSWRCGKENCGRRFNRLTDLQRHYERHHLKRARASPSPQR